MNLVFISNIEFSNPAIAGHDYSPHIATINSSIDSICASLNQIKKDGNAVFIIDVHCTIKGAEKMQQQGGVIIYRHLLKQFDGNQDKLNVIFYSPISKEDLVKLKPENYVLTLLPFVELFPDTKQYDINPKDWTFENALMEAEKESCPQLNNASENLLSGWALSNKETISKGQQPKRINTNGKNVLFIDDQQSEWKEAFLQLFLQGSIQYVKNNKGFEIESQRAYRTKLKSNWNSFTSLIANIVVNKQDLILSDFYLEENHDITKWKDVSEIQKVSGYKVFNEIRLLAPSIPYTFYTSSNKASIYKFLDANGVDDWIVKDVRTDSSKEEKLENFMEFKNCMDKFLCSYTYIQLNIIWKNIEKTEKNFTELWWNTTKLANRKETIFFILKESWFGLRRAAKKEALFEQAIYISKIYSDDSFTATAVINSMGKILELLKATKKNGLAVIINHMRNIASHGRKDLNCFTIQDGIFANRLLLELLQQEKLNSPNIPRPNVNLYPPNSDESFKFALFWLYIQLYNSGFVNSHLIAYTDVIEKRISEIFDLAKNDTVFLKILNTEFLSYKAIDARVQGKVLRKINLVFEIAVNL